MNLDYKLKLCYNLLIILFLNHKSTKMYLRKICQLLEIIINEKIFVLENIIKNLYIIWIISNA